MLLATQFCAGEWGTLGIPLPTDLADCSCRPGGTCLTRTVDTPDLAELVPGLMARHPAHDWAVLSGRVEGEDLRVEISPNAAPDRVATVVVHSGAEIFGCMFAGHESNDFAYEDADRPEVL